MSTHPIDTGPTSVDPGPASAGKRSSKRKTGLSKEQALAHRVAAALDLSQPGLVPASLPAAPAPEAVTALAAVTPQSELFDAGVGRLNEAVASAQEMARETAQSIADSRLQTAQTLMAFQQKVLAMMQANLSQGFAAAQSLVRAPNVGEAIRMQNHYAQGAVKAFTAQAAELRTLSVDLAREAQQPWVSHWTKSIDQLRHGLGA